MYPAPKRAVANYNVVIANAGGSHPDQYVTRSHDWRRYLTQG
jgi:hypothetical protein